MGPNPEAQVSSHSETWLPLDLSGTGYIWGEILGLAAKGVGVVGTTDGSGLGEEAGSDVCPRVIRSGLQGMWPLES